ncbi:hypothetical protein ABVT39_001138 [Epinephelus coioides]
MSAHVFFSCSSCRSSLESVVVIVICGTELNLTEGSTADDDDDDDDGGDRPKLQSLTLKSQNITNTSVMSRVTFTSGVSNVQRPIQTTKILFIIITRNFVKIMSSYL